VRHAIGIALTLAVAGCREPTTPLRQLQVANPGEVTLRIGEEVVVDGVLRVKFVGVPADSRCPSSVLCVWAGDAAVALDAGPVAAEGPVALCPDTLHTNLGPSAEVCATYYITLLEVTPYPQVPGPIPPGHYAVRLGFSAAPPPAGVRPG
jgi:hypothetical protein